jgi:hypothetical protein
LREKALADFKAGAVSCSHRSQHRTHARN